MMGAGLNQQGPIAMAKKQHGSTLIEVLIALLVLSFGMMGMAGVQSVSLRGNQAAYFRTQATSLSMDIVERMRANLTAVGAGDYNNVSGERPRRVLPQPVVPAHRWRPRISMTGWRR